MPSGETVDAEFAVMGGMKRTLERAAAATAQKPVRSLTSMSPYSKRSVSLRVNGSQEESGAKSQ
jgi:hypothetical protein